MHRSTLKWLLALALIVGSTGGVSSIAMASEHDHLSEYHAATKLYFPFVPNNTSIGDTGPWHGSITVQSMESEWVEVWVLPDGRFDPDRALHSFRLHDYGSKTLTAEELGIDEAGQSLVIAAIEFDVWQARNNPTALSALDAFGELTKPKVTATLKQSSPEPMDEGVWTGDSHRIVDGYSAIPMNDVGWGDLSSDCPTTSVINCGDVSGLDGVDGVSYLPLAQSNNDWNTILYVTNVDGAIDGESMVSVELIPTEESENGQDWSEEMRLTPGEPWVIDVESEVGTGWIGSVRIESDAGTAAVAARHKSQTSMLLMNTSAPSQAESSDYRLYAPLVYVDYYGWNTGISLANEADSTNTVLVRFYNPAGDQVGERSTTIEGNGHSFIYLPSEVEQDDDDGWLGSAVIESTNGYPFHAAVDQVNYDDGRAMSYTLGSSAADTFPGNEQLGLALLQKGNSLGETGDMSGIQLFNPDPENDITVEIQLYSQNGSPINLTTSGEVSIELEALASETFFVPDEGDIPMGSVAGVVVTVVGGDGQVVAVSNVTNLDVQGDGAAVFNLSDAFGRFR